MHSSVHSNRTTFDTAIPSSSHRIPFRIAKLSLTGPFSTGVGDHSGSSWCCIALHFGHGDGTLCMLFYALPTYCANLWCARWQIKWATCGKPSQVWWHLQWAKGASSMVWPLLVRHPHSGKTCGYLGWHVTQPVLWSKVQSPLVMLARPVVQPVRTHQCSAASPAWTRHYFAIFFQYNALFLLKDAYTSSRRLLNRVLSN